MLPEIFVTAGEKHATYQEPVAAPIFRKSFEIHDLSSAELVIGATGFYDLFLNGEKITDGYLAPFISNPEQTIFFNCYDLTNKLQDGKNVIGVMLGNGFANPIGGNVWGHDKNCRPPAFALSFNSSDTFFTAKDMKWNYSHILFDDYRCGTYCDMTKEIKNWHKPDYDDTGWNEPKTTNFSRADKRLCKCEPVREIRKIKAVEFYPAPLREYRMRDCFKRLYNGDTIMEKTPLFGGYIYDFGENNSGVPLLKIKGKKGQKIHMQFCELMFEGFADYINTDVYPDGCCQKDIYVCGSDEEETYIPPFTYHGFRYCYIYGITEEQATSDLLTFIVLHNDVEIRGEFSCSDEISNQIFKACRRSDESNLFYILTDCPQREKNGWTGDAAISAEHYLMNLGVEKCFDDWLCCLRNAQAADGSLPLLVPSSGGTDKSPVWDSMLFYLPYYVYIHTGNTEIISNNAEAMIKNLLFCLSLRDERGIVESGYGDWLPVDTPPGVYSSPLGFCCTIILMEMCKMAEFMLNLIGMKLQADFCKSSYEELKTAVRKEYNQNGIITKGKTTKYQKLEYRICQTSQVLGLYTGLFDDDEKETAINTLIKLIQDKNNSFDCGFLGLRFLFHVLSEYGYTDLAYEMITKPSYPSYANMIYRGETTVWERFAPPGKRIGSHNHHFMADVSSWYLKYVAGINVNPDKNNPNKIYFSPNFVKAITNVHASYKTPEGKFTVNWERNSEQIIIKIKLEGNVTVEYDEDIKHLITFI